jgi:hypothetical protein
VTSVLVLAFLILLAGLTGYYIGPGFGRYVSWGIAFALLLVMVRRVFNGGRGGKGIAVRPEVQGPPDFN